MIKMASRQKDNIINRGDEIEDLLIFGYSCKLFRDDEKALYIDQGKHLIPWMGDESLKIDRYDARGTLYDLKDVEAPSGGFDRFFGLTDIEKQVETMCDEERYRALMTNEEEETLYQEEELKRLHFALGDRGKEYGQVEYKYDGNSNDIEPVKEETVEKCPNDGAEDEPFVPSPQLDLPVDMILPETVKHNAIIEKTAFFINSQGPQMEILLKMKQAGNPLFNFLSFDNPLHSYYRHLLMAIKGGRYKSDTEKPNEKNDAENEDDDNYLHPSLASSVSKVELAPSIPSINYKPSAHCAYSMLVNKIKDKKAKGDTLPNLTKLKQALQSLNHDKKEENMSGNESDSNCSSESKSSVKSKSSSHSTVSLNSFKSNQHTERRPHEIPPNDVQVIIDKMASYVAKNGRDFETIVQMKKDPRFDFLNSTHIFYPYYQNKVKQYENLEKGNDPEEKSDEINIKGKEEQTKAKLAPVCFSIKKPKESENVIEKSALPVEESSDEEGKEEGKKENYVIEDKEKEAREEIVTVDLAAAEDKEEKNKKILATERIKDKLTAAVREKVAIASKEKQLQLERKRRAVAFLKNLQAETGSLNISTPQGPHLTERQGGGRINDEDSDIASLPDEIDEFVDDKKNSSKVDGRLKRDSDGNEKRHKTCGSVVRHKSSGDHQERLEYREKSSVNERKSDEVPDRTTDSSFSSDENDKRKTNLSQDSKKYGKRKFSEDSYLSKTDRQNVSHSEEKRHRRRKHKKEDGRDKDSRKHCKSRKQKRSKESDSERRSKRSRRCSGSSSDP